MARPRIRPSARSIPISFSVKPDLAAKIDEYSHQIRFSRSKFLAQAVTEAITKIEMGYDLSDFDVRNMTDSQKLAIALNTLNEPTPEQQINLNIARILRDKLNDLLGDAQESPRNAPSEPSEGHAGYKRTYRLKPGLYAVVDKAEEFLARIEKEGNSWVRTDTRTGQRFVSTSLAEAKKAAERDYYYASQE